MHFWNRQGCSHLPQGWEVPRACLLLWVQARLSPQKGGWSSGQHPTERAPGCAATEPCLQAVSYPSLPAQTFPTTMAARDLPGGRERSPQPLPPAQSSTGEQAPQDSAGPGLSAFELQRKHESLTVYQFKAGLQLPGAGLSPPPDNYTRSNAITGPTFYIKQEGPS